VPGRPLHDLAVIYATASGRDRGYPQACARFSVSVRKGVRMSEEKRDLSPARIREHQIPEAESLVREYGEKVGPK
jgi:hypothetical protein